MGAKKIGVANQKLIKSNNLSLVFDLINQNEPISRARLTKLTGLSPTTVSALVDELCSMKMVEELGTPVTNVTGRKPVMVQVAPTGGYVIGIELSSKGFSAGLYDLKGNLTRERTGDISQLITALEDMVELDINKLIGIAIGIPAIIDKSEMKISASTLLSPDEAHAAIDAIYERFPNVRVQVGNESSFSAYCEKYELGGNVKSLVYVEINDGIGAGIVLDNKIFTGAFGNAGELGHVSVDLNGEKCPCGSRGCLEMLASVPALLNRAGKSSLRDVIATLDDESTKGALHEVCRYLAVGLNNMINILNPEVIIIGGAMAKLGGVFLTALREEIEKIGFDVNVKNMRIYTSKVSGNAACRGAARYLLDKIFHSSEFWIE